MSAVFGIDFPTRHLPRDGNLLSRALRWLGSRGAWMELCYALVALPFVGWVGSFLVFFAWGAALALLTFPLWGLAADGAGILFGLHIGYVPSAASTSPPAPVRCTPRRGSPAASPPCRSRWRGCCSSRASASA